LPGESAETYPSVGYFRGVSLQVFPREFTLWLGCEPLVGTDVAQIRTDLYDMVEYSDFRKRVGTPTQLCTKIPHHGGCRKASSSDFMITPLKEENLAAC